MKSRLLLLPAAAFLCVITARAQNVGVGTQAPAYPFTVKDSLNVTSMGIAQVSPDGQTAVGTFANNGNAYIQTHTNTDLNFATNNGNSSMVLQKVTGNVGIGTNMNPTEKLMVDGNVKISGTLKLPSSNPGMGKVLTSDAAGNATWQSPAPTTPVAISTSGFVGIVDETQTSLTIPSSATGQLLPFGEFPSVAYTFDDGNNLNGSYTVPSTGFYHFEVTINFLGPVTASQDGSIFISLYKNGTFIAPMSATGVYNGEGVPSTINGGSINIKLQTGDIISVRIGQTSGQTLTMFNSALNGPATRFSGYRIY